ncbi:MAG TPA: PAS domain S-box protein [Anaerolineae bacterium]|nr:PAS domain S-box protein [Anaerolineae bacterium]
MDDRPDQLLHDREARVRHMADSTTDLIAEIDLNGIFTYASPSFKTVLGYDAESLIGVSVFDYGMLHRDDLECVVASGAEQARLRGTGEERAWRQDIRARHVDGHNVWLELATRLLRDERGQIIGTVCVGRDISERRRVEEALRASEERYRGLFEGVPVGVYRTTPAGDILAANPALVQMLGYPDLETYQKLKVDADLYVDAEHRRQWQAQIEREGIIRDFETCARRRDGTVIWVRDSARVVRDATGQVLYYEGTWEDITERKRAEEALAHRDLILEAVSYCSERFLREGHRAATIQAGLERLGQATDVSRVYIFENHTDPVGTLLTSQRYEWVAPGITPQIDNPDLEAIPLAEAGFGRWIDLLGQGQPVHGLVKQLPRSEQAVLAPQDIKSIAVMPIFVSGQWWGFIGFDECRSERMWSSTEIDALRAAAGAFGAAIQNAQAEAALRQAHDVLEIRIQERTAELERERKQMQTILDAAGEGIVLIDRYNVIWYINAAMEQLSGYTLAEALCRTPFLWSPVYTAPAVIEDLQRCLACGEAWRGEVINQRKDGTLFDAALTLNPLSEADGQVLAFVGVQRDITLRKELDRLKNQFVSRIGHELRTPVANVKLYLDLLEHGKPDKREQYRHILLRETERLRRLIEGFLEMSQLDAGAIPIHLVPADLNRLVVDLVSGRSAVAAERGLTLTHHPAPDLPQALADPALLAQVLSKLLENALNYTPRGGCITVTTAVRDQADQDWITCSVQDVGPGISPEDMLHLFERFYRGEAARDFTTPGVGLGLAICKAIVDRLGGRLTAESWVGGGTVFTVWLRPVHYHTLFTGVSRGADAVSPPVPLPQPPMLYPKR